MKKLFLTWWKAAQDFWADLTQPSGTTYVEIEPHQKEREVMTQVITAQVSVRKEEESPVDLLGSRIASKLLSLGLVEVDIQKEDGVNLMEGEMFTYTVKVEVVLPEK